MKARDESPAENLAAVNARIDSVLEDTMRSRDSVTLVAVSKRQPLARIIAAYEAGIRDFGESQIQEGIPKVRAAPEDIVWHFIGHLQKNKVRKAVKHFAYIHSIDSMSLLQRVEDIACEERVCPKIFLQVNYVLDPDKHGLHPEAVRPVLEVALTSKHVDCLGLMGIPPQGATEEKIKSYFEGIERMRDDLRGDFPDWPGKLSLGMTSDFELALSVGADYIRVGTAIFGERTS